MLRLRPVVTRQWIEQQGVVTAGHLKQSQRLQSEDTDTEQNGNHVTASAQNGDGESGTLRPCQCRLTASLLQPSTATTTARPSAHLVPTIATISPAAVDEATATLASQTTRDTPSPITPTIPSPAAFPASSLASLPSSSSRSKSHRTVLTSNAPPGQQQQQSSSPSVPAAATSSSPATFDSSVTSTASASSSLSSSTASSPVQRSEWSDEETVSRLPQPYSASSWSAILSHLLHVLSRDAVSRSAFASQVHLSLSTVSRVLSGQPRVKRIEYGRMRVWLWRRDEEYVRVREEEGRGGSGVTGPEWEEWQALTMDLEQRQRIDAKLIAADEGAPANGAANQAGQAAADLEHDASTTKAEDEGETTDVSMDTDEDGVKDDASMEVDSNGAYPITPAIDEVVNVRGTRRGGSRSSRGRRQSPALKPADSDSQAAVMQAALSLLPSSSLSSSESSPSSATASSTLPLSATPSSPTPSSTITSSSLSLAAPSPSPPVVFSSSPLLSSLSSISPAYFSSADAIIDRLDFYILQLHLSQKTVAHLTTLPLTTVSQLIRRVYKPWPTDEQPLVASAASPSAVFALLAALLWWLDGMLSGLVRGRVGNVHDTCNLAFLSSLTVSGLSRERLNVWLDGKTANPLHDRQWIDEIAVKEFGVTQEAVLKEWERTRGAAVSTGGTTEAASGNAV